MKLYFRKIRFLFLDSYQNEKLIKYHIVKGDV